MNNLNKLSRTEMKNVTGGVAQGGSTQCWITTSGPNHSNPQTGWILVDGSGSGASSIANSYCVNLIATAGNGVNHCSYNCGVS
ncbi:MAG: bacteriocin-like protein [Mucilaginibacter sp.]